jgi:soluble lytic murein transglycosylase
MSVERQQRRRIRRAVAFAGLVGLAGSASLAVVDPTASELRAGLRAAREGRIEDADAALAAAARSEPLVADHAALLRSEMLVDAGRWDSAIQVARAALQASHDTPLRARLHRAEARAFLEAGNEPAARVALEEARRVASDPELEAELTLELAASLERAGRARQAAGLYRSVWVEVPSLEQANRAETRLAALEGELGVALRDGRDWRRHGDAVLDLRRTEEALAAYDRALAARLSPADRRRAHEKRARCLFFLRRYPEAVKAFAHLSRANPEARLWHARSMARAGDVPGAVQRLEALATSGPRSLRSRARYTAALLLEEDHPDRARVHFEKLARSRAGSLSRAALWNLGWADYRAGRMRPRLQARYWSARALEMHDPARARRDLADLGAEFPLSYYGWRAARRAPAYTSPPAPRALPAGDPASLRPAQLARPRILVAAGLPEAAGAELLALETLATGRDERIELATLFSEAGDHNAAQRVVLSTLGEELARGPLPGREEAWWLAWPLAWDAQVQRWAAASDGSIEPALVWAIMREESGYRPAVVSTAGARGLLQIMPTTGERLAQDSGLRAFRSEDLFEPAVNIRLGAHYLDQLSRRFRGRPSAAIGSYNAGPEAVARWIEERPALPDDEWVESVPYSQTRRYVKRVLRSIHAYRALY